jgi:hypothetical protein
MLKGHFIGRNQRNRQASETILQVLMTPFGCWYPKGDLEVSTTIKFIQMALPLAKIQC